MQTLDTIRSHFGSRRVSVCEVYAKMPRSVRAEYCHLRVYLEGSAEPRAHALAKLTEGIDYIEFRRVPRGGRTNRSQRGAIYAAVADHNAAVADHNAST